MAVDRSLAARPTHEQVRELLAWIGVVVEERDLVGRDTDGIPRLLRTLRTSATSIVVEPTMSDARHTFTVRWRDAGTRTDDGMIVTTSVAHPDVAAADRVEGPIYTSTPLGLREVAPTLAEHVVATLHHDAMHAQRFQLRAELENGIDPGELLREMAPMPGGRVGDGFLGTYLEPSGSLFPKARFWAGAPRRETLVELWDERWGFATLRDRERRAAARVDHPADLPPTHPWDLDRLRRRFDRWNELERELLPVRAERNLGPDLARRMEIAEERRRGLMLRPPLAPSRVDEVEERLGVALPADHRRFLVEVGDGTEAGTAVRPLDHAVAHSDLSEPFRLRRAIAPVWGDGVTPNSTAGAKHDGWPIVGRGTLAIADLGDAMVARLVLRGDRDELGSVWRDDTANSGSVSFWRTSFRTYVERWLDAQIDEAHGVLDRLHRVPLAEQRP